LTKRDENKEKNDKYLVKLTISKKYNFSITIMQLIEIKLGNKNDK